MFCSRCGKTIPQGSSACAHCGMEIAGGEFSAASYIASQPAQTPDENAAQTQPRYARYTRTTYTTMPVETDGDVLRGTSYRPVYQESEPQEEQEAAEQSEEQIEVGEEQQETEQTDEEQAPAEPQPKGDPSKLPENMRFQPFKPVKLAGISPETAERMRQQAEREEQGEQKPARPSVPKLFSSIGRGAKSAVPKREVFEQYDDEDEAAENSPEEYEEYSEEYPEEDEVFDTSDIEEEEDAPARAPLFSLRRENSAPTSRKTVILRTVIAVACVLVLLIGGFIWVSLSTAAKSPIAGVTYTLYEQGIELIESHTTDAYRSQMITLYTQDPTGASVLAQQTQDQTAIRALLPGTPLANDEDFVETLLAIQSNIDIAVTLDGLDAITGSSENAAASQARWQAIENAIKRLKTTNSASDFSAISSSAEVTATPTPSPTATPSPYSTLTKGMLDNDDVRAMQNRLYELGWFTDVRDGDFGPQTQTVVKQFQQAAGLSVTGIADPETLAAIYAEDAPRTGTKITPPPSSGDGSVTGEALATDAPAQPES